MKMTIYHGSKDIVSKPIYGYGKKNNDYGLGFYCTEELDLAKEWAVDSGRDGFANMYSLESEGLELLDLSVPPYNILNWLAILLQNRDLVVTSPIASEAKKYILSNFAPDTSSFDLIIGYRADDSYFSFARDFLNNTISLQQLSAAMLYGNLGKQIVLVSEKAFEHIEFEKEIVAESNLWFPKKEMRDATARKKYFDLRKQSFKRGETYILKIIEEELGIDDLQL